MKRRDFLASSAAGAAALTLLPHIRINAQPNGGNQTLDFYYWDVANGVAQSLLALVPPSNQNADSDETRWHAVVSHLQDSVRRALANLPQETYQAIESAVEALPGSDQLRRLGASRGIQGFDQFFMDSLSRLRTAARDWLYDHVFPVFTASYEAASCITRKIIESPCVRAYGQSTLDAITGCLITSLALMVIGPEGFLVRFECCLAYELGNLSIADLQHLYECLQGLDFSQCLRNE